MTIIWCRSHGTFQVTFHATTIFMNSQQLNIAFSCLMYPQNLNKLIFCFHFIFTLDMLLGLEVWLKWNSTYLANLEPWVQTPVTCTDTKKIHCMHLSHTTECFGIFRIFFIGGRPKNQFSVGNFAEYSMSF
jgi:hypothetical protein